MRAKRRIEISGRRFGRLLVLSFDKNTWNNCAMWSCKCDCGSTKSVRGSHLINSQVVSCGCHKAELASKSTHSVKHGMSNSITYNSWSAMTSRCSNQSHRYYSKYGGRGIKVCKRWYEFEKFLEDMGERPSKSHSIDRRDNDGNYDPANCRWATNREQSRNRSNNHTLEYLGISKTIAEWSEISGLNYTTIKERVFRGWPVDRALTKSTHQ